MVCELYAPLALPELDAIALRRGLQVQIRLFYAGSVPGSVAPVVRFWTAHNGTCVRCNYGRKLEHVDPYLQVDKKKQRQAFADVI